MVDNNCSDGSIAIAREYGFVRVVKESRQGIVHARDKGFNTAKADIFTRIDADTILPRNWVKHVRKFYGGYKSAQYAWTGGGYFYNVGFPRLNGWLLSQVIYRMNRAIMGHYILWGSNMVITSAQWQKVKNKVCLRNDIHEDLDLAMHLHDRGYEITYDATIKVGVFMKRVYIPSDLRKNLAMWPQTLRTHHKKGWVFGWLGAQIIFVLSSLRYIFVRR